MLRGLRAKDEPFELVYKEVMEAFPAPRHVSNALGPSRIRSLSTPTATLQPGCLIASFTTEESWFHSFDEPWRQ